MEVPRPPWLLAVLGLIGAAFVIWAVLESGRQRQEIELALMTEATTLAGSLGPGLAAAAAATRQLDDILASRLLDNARFAAHLPIGDSQALEELAAAGELDSIAIFDAEGRLLQLTGEPSGASLAAEIGPILDGAVDEIVLGSVAQHGIEHLAVALSDPDGGAVAVQVEVETAWALSRRLGVENLLRRVVGQTGVLYLAYTETPDGTTAEVTWDGLPIPAMAAGGLRELRGRRIFEVPVSVEAPAGQHAMLRVGLDGAPIVRSARAATGRALVVGAVLAALGLAAATLAILIRAQDRERREHAKRLAEADAARKRSERLAAAGALSAGLAHEVRSPLNAIHMAAQRLERNECVGEACLTFSRTIQQEVQRLEKVLRDFLELARPVSDERRAIDLTKLAREVTELLEVEADECRVGLVVDGPPNATTGDPDAVRRALINLVRNAIFASPAGEEVQVVSSPGGSWARLRILDRGKGIDESDVERLFEAFVSENPTGTGLGLSLVRRVAEEHSGRVRLTRRVGGGTEAILDLPVTA